MTKIRVTRHVPEDVEIDVEFPFYRAWFYLSDTPPFRETQSFHRVYEDHWIEVSKETDRDGALKYEIEIEQGGPECWSDDPDSMLGRDRDSVGAEKAFRALLIEMREALDVILEGGQPRSKR